jgi:hypothetical protein
MSFGRLQTRVDAAIIEADPAGAEQRAAAAAKERFVRLGRSSEHGLKMIIARAAAGDAIPDLPGQPQRHPPTRQHRIRPDHLARHRRSSRSRHE